MSALQSTSTPAHKWLRSNVATATGLPTFNRVVTTETQPDTYIVVGAVKKLKQDWAGLGNMRRDEHYVIPCFVRVFQKGNVSDSSVDTMYDTAWQYVNGVVAVITRGLSLGGVVGDPTLGGNVIFAELQDADEVEPASTTAGGIEVGVTFDIACRSQIAIS